MNLIEITNNFPDELNAIKHFLRIRWGKTPKCAYCGSQNIGKSQSRNLIEKIWDRLDFNEGDRALEQRKRKTGSVDYTTNPGMMIGRRNLAKFMVDIIEKLEYFKKAPIISEKQKEKSKYEAVQKVLVKPIKRITHI